MCLVCLFFNDSATTEIYTLSLHDALPISGGPACPGPGSAPGRRPGSPARRARRPGARTEGVGHSPAGGRRRHGRGSGRSEEHTSELQSRQYLVCRLLLEKKKTPLFEVTLC